MAILTSKPKAIFIHIPKNAGTSITRWLQRHARGKKHPRDGKHSKMDMHMHEIDNHFAFACVRNPYDWVYSGYSYMKKYKNFKGITLEDYILKGRMLDFVNGDPQHRYLDIDRMDLIMKYETLTEDFKKVQSFFNNNKGLGRENPSKRDENWENVLTDDMKEKIYKTYKTDFNLFGYTI